MLVHILKHSFTGGEWSPSLYGRTDLQTYPTAARLLQNVIVHPYGGASNRGGTQFVGEVKDSDAVTRLVGFQFSVVQSYMLEFGNLYMRIYKDGARVVEADVTITDATQADPVVITAAGHGYSNGDWIVISDVVGMTELNGKIFIVANKTPTTFELTDVDGNDIDGTSYTAYTSGGTSAKIYELTTTYLTADIPLLKFEQSADVLYVTHPSYPPRKISRTGHTSWTISDITFQASIGTPTNLVNGGSGINYKVTAVAENGEESTPSSAVNGGAGSPTTWDAVSGAEYYNVYKETNSSGTYAWIGMATSTTFTEPGATIDPDITKSPPTTKDPFSGADDYPGCAMFFEQRLVFARTNNNPQTLWGSVTGSFENMNISSPLQDDDSYNFTINARQVNEIRWMVPLNDMIIGTSDSEWKMTSGTNSDAITPSSVNLKMQSQYGVSHVPPVVIGTNVIFVEGSGDTVRDMNYSLEKDAYIGDELTLMASHLLEDQSVVEWCYQRHPDSIIWVVRDDGILLSLTYQKEHQVFAWAQHNTNGTFESIATITSSAGVNEVWTIVNRTINGSTRRYVERFLPRLPDEDVQDAYFVDCGLTLDDPIDITGATQADPVVITATAHGFSNGDYVDIVDVGGMTEINDIRFIVANKTANTFELTDEDGNDVDGTDYTAYTSGGEVRKAVTSVTGLQHLEGESVAVLANGNVVTGKSVSNATITLSNRASRIHVGLGYTSNIETLDFDYPTQTGQTVQDQKRNIKSVMLRLKNTREIWIGPDSDNLDEVPFREDENMGAPIELYTGDKEVFIPFGAIDQSRLYIQCVDPVPFTVLAIVARIENSDD